MEFVRRAAKSEKIFIAVVSLVPASLFLKPGFITVAIVILLLYSLFRFLLLRNAGQEVNQFLFLPLVLFAVYLLWDLAPSGFNGGAGLLIRKIPLLAIPVCFILLNRSDVLKHTNAVLSVFLAASVICSLYCYVMATVNIVTHNSIIYPYSDQSSSFYFTYEGLTFPTGIDPLYMGLYFDFALIILLCTTAVKRKLLRKILIVYVLFFILLIASKIGLLVCVLFLVGLILRRFQNKLKASAIAGGITLIFIVTVFTVPFLHDRFLVTTTYDYHEQDGSHWNSVTHRLAIWRCAADAIAEHPVVGYGTGQGQKALEAVYDQRGFYWGQIRKYNPHSEFLSITLDSGMTGLALLLAILLVPLYYFLRSPSPAPFCFLLMILLFFLTECLLLRQKGVVFFAFFFSLLSFSAFSGELQKKPDHITRS